MNKIQIKFPDGNSKEIDSGKKIKDIIQEEIGDGLLRAAIAAEIDGNKIVDLNTPITTTTTLNILSFKDKKGKEIYWHSSSHILALAVKRLFKNVKFGIGPSIDQGFYYDFDINKNFTEEDLKNIEQEAKKILKEKIHFERLEVDYNKAKEIFKDQPYKLELIEDIKNKGELISLYKLEDWYDLCRGPHVEHTGKIKAFKILRNSGAYWKGNSKNKQLQRIYGISFSNKEELKEFIHLQEEAKKRDHNKVGRELDLFITNELIGQGLPLFTPKGAKIKQLLQRWIEDLEEQEYGYQLTMTPYMAKSDLYKISGHWDHYKEGMFIFKNEGLDFALRPMTCPFQFQIYNSKKRSYKELPIRYNETSTLFRNEASGEMHGLIRVRQFTLSEGHIICMPEQVAKEFKNVLKLISVVMSTLGIQDDIWYQFSKWDPKNKEKYINDPAAWDITQKMMKEILDDIKLKYVEAEGEAAFYGPKLDVQFKNTHGKEDTLFTVQIDFALPKKFDMTYVDSDNTEKQVYVIHRSSIGCYERTIAMLIEKYEGKFPLWLNPIQVILLPIADRHNKYTNLIAKELKNNGLRVNVDYDTSTMNKKIRNAQLSKINYILVIGDEEEKNNTINVRTRDNEILGEKNINDFIKELIQEVKEKRIVRKK
jgi:threonyl-tRNA synthetase